MSERLQPAFWGGLFIGVLSALPLVNAANCCCCLWVVAGGVLATYLRQQNTPLQIDASEGALVGLMAGAIGGVISGILSIPLQMMMGGMQAEMAQKYLENPDIPPEIRDLLLSLTAGSAMQVLAMVVTIVVFTIFGLAGGLLGVAIFKKSPPPLPPPGTVEVLPPV